jgi:hypothetical protein
MVFEEKSIIGEKIVTEISISYTTGIVEIKSKKYQPLRVISINLKKISF